MEGLVERFQQHVRLNRTSTAVQDDLFVLTFEQLDRWTDVLARVIYGHSQPATAPINVAICIPRSTLLVVAILAVVKAGFAYVPLDPAAPLARLEDQVTQCDAQMVLVASSRTAAQFKPILRRAEILDVAFFVTGPHVTDPENSPPFGIKVDPSALLAILFTSGSTGRPKGVLIEHASMINVVAGPTLEVSPGEHVALTANPSFDAASFEIWNSLVHGAHIFILTAHLADTEAVVKFFHEHQIQKAFLPTAVFHRLFSDDASAASLGATLRMVNIGGERLNTNVVKTFLRNAPQTRLTNGYGAAETTVCATLFDVNQEALEFDDGAGRPIPIGRPIPNTKFFLLDHELGPVDLGEPGEICISGAALARGYLDPSQASSAKFTTVADLEGPGTTTRIYRTGDLGRLVNSHDGPILEYIGRNDRQVKIRGQRVEPGEIEAVLCSGMNGAGEAAVVTTDDDKMIAYVVKRHVNHGTDPADGAKLTVNQEAWDAFQAQYDWENIDPTKTGADFTGWVSMYDGIPIPRLEMEDWLTDTLNGIPVKPDDSVLEIGCGTGMILFALEHRCKEYFAVDMSAPSLAFVEAQLEHRGLQHKVQTAQGMADQLPYLIPALKRFDLVIINSVVQYFPSREYLEDVLRLCVERMNDGGRIFLGDLRSLGLDLHHDLARVLHCDPSPDLLASEIQERIEVLQSRQGELKTNPSFFYQYKTSPESRISHVEILPKMMTSRNELSQFRYQVILHVGSQSPSLVSPSEWTEYTTSHAFEHALATSHEDILAVRGIPNSLVAREEVILGILNKGRPSMTASELLQTALTSEWYTQGMAPRDLVTLGAKHGWSVNISLKSPAVSRTLAAIFTRASDVKADFGDDNDDSELTNKPTGTILAPGLPDEVELAASLRALCRLKLPAYMVPDYVLVKDALPLTSNGKVDRALLTKRTTWAEDVEIEARLACTCEPKNPTQARLQRCVGEILEIDPLKIPLDTGLIEMGLHSFRAPKLLAVMRAEFNLDVLPYATIYKHPTISLLAAYLDELLITKSYPPPKSASAERPRREVEYDRSALDNVLRVRGLTEADIEDVYETTGTQRLCLSGPTPSCYIVHQLYTADTDVETLVSALDAVLIRQTTLRTTMFDNNTRQVVFKYSPKLRNEMIHIHNSNETRSVQDILKDAGHHVFTPPDNLVHFDVYQSTPVTLLYHVHHALLDAWSRDCLFSEVESLMGKAALPDPVPFRNFVDYVLTEVDHAPSVGWFAERFLDLDAAPFPVCDESSTFSTCSVLGQNVEREEQVPGLTRIPQNFGIQPSTLLKVAMALVMRHETMRNSVAFGQIYFCRNAALEGITQICGPTFNYLVDCVDFRPDETVLQLLHRTQLSDQEAIDRSFVDFDQVQQAVSLDLTPFARFSWSSRSEEEPTVKTLLQPGALGLESDLAIDWTTVVDNEQVKILVDHDSLFSDRMKRYAQQFFQAACWLVANIEAENLNGVNLFDTK